MAEQPSHPHYFALREQVLTLPTLTNGYPRVLFVGTTGVGKTTLVQQFLGVDPTTEKFPAASGGKTTTADLELVLTPGSYKAVVTFLPREAVLTYVQECLLAAALACYEYKSPKDVANEFLEHTEQRFRLRYILGDSPIKERGLRRWPESTANAFQVTRTEAQQFDSTVQSYLHAVSTLVEAVRADIEEGLSNLGDDVNHEDRDIYSQGRLEELLTQQASFHMLINEIVAEIQKRFQLLLGGTLEVDGSEWPISWRFETPNREEFLRTIYLFSSIDHPSFGKLLTPLVQGIRTAGPFRPQWRPNPPPRLVLIDGEGLGHTTATVTSISTRISDLFKEVDVIVLVDHAKSPMQAAAHAVLETVVNSGHTGKLFVSFTHFEEVRGDNFADRSAREEHVKNSLDQALLQIGKKIGQRDKYILKRSLERRVFFLSLAPVKSPPQEDPISSEAIETQGELRRMLAAIEAIEIPPPPEGLQPIYSESKLFSFIQKAVKAFRTRWRALMAISRLSNVSPEPWSRIKALSRRVSERGEEEYKDLRPVADLMKEVTDQIRQFLEKPDRWIPPDYGSEEMRQAAIDAIAREFHQRLHSFIRNRMIVMPHADWTIAFKRAGPGSARVRAHDIDQIYHTVAPTLYEIIDLDHLSTPPVSPIQITITTEKDDVFAIQIITFVREAIEVTGARIVHQ
jgi:hypothetical protein